MKDYHFIPARRAAVPILVSVPHCGIAFPEEVVSEYDPVLISRPVDTDWYVDRLYDFAPSMGISMITAHYSRWVIDLNRDPESKPLYSDGRIITGLCPATTFLGESFYRDKRNEVMAAEVNRRVEAYYRPYHERIEKELIELKREFGIALLWDCHSIKQVVPTIQKDKFPDLILGNADQTSASPELIDVALKNLASSSYDLHHNHPFKGGYITRHFGKPFENQHALQLEMTKVNYMDDREEQYDAVRANKVRKVLERTFGELVEKLLSLSK